MMRHLRWLLSVGLCLLYLNVTINFGLFFLVTHSNYAFRITHCFVLNGFKFLHRIEDALHYDYIYHHYRYWSLQGASQFVGDE